MNLAGVMILGLALSTASAVQPPFYTAFNPQLRLSPQLIYNYVNSYAGLLPGPGPEQKIRYPVRVEDFGPQPDEKHLFDRGSKEPITERPHVAKPSHLLPSDFVLLAHTPQSNFYGNFDAIKNSRMKFSSPDHTALPPVGGSISNYILTGQNSWDFMEKSKRQAGFDDEDSVEITANKPRVESGNCSTSSSPSNNDTQEVQQTGAEQQPSIAQSKPAAIALAGKGGVAQASPVGTAVVGPGGMAIAAPSATAVAGQGAQGGVQLASDEKVRKGNNNNTNEERETS